MRVRHTSAVDREIVEAVAFYLSEESPQSAERFDAEVQEAEHLIAKQPYLYPIVENGIRAKQLDGFPFAVLYSIEGDEIVIVAVSHAKRKPGYWRKRT
jgi:plasmid stabilization system protein ParE